MKNDYNPILDTDSYKFSHPWQYPPGTTEMFSYVEARGSTISGIDKVQFFGMQGFIDNYLKTPITKDNIEEAEDTLIPHGVPFHREGWEHILDKWGGYAPIIVRAVPEGLNVPLSMPLVTVRSIDPKVFWAVGHYEAQILRAAWYGTTVATISKAAKNIIYKALRLSSDDPDGQIPFKLHDFGARGVSSYESSCIGGAAHLTNFKGSDTVAAIKYLKKHYHPSDTSLSISASEHATTTSWGREKEAEAYRNMIKSFGHKGKFFAVVSDSYSIFNAVDNIWGKELKQEVIDSGATLVIRPDSGNPVDIVMYCMRSLSKSFGFTTNSKGFKVLKNVRVIQGDGVNLNSIQEILNAMLAEGFSIDNIAFGMGGALLQKVDRDTFKFAMKCSSITVNGKDVPVFKDPITDSGKSSKKGVIGTFYNEEKGIYWAVSSCLNDHESIMHTVYSGADPESGSYFETSLDYIRLLSNKVL